MISRELQEQSRSSVEAIDLGTNPENPREMERLLEQSLELFDFSIPLPTKNNKNLRVYYNNCNGLEINNLVSDHIKQKKDKATNQYIADIEVPSKLDNIIQQMRAWNVDVVSLAEVCTDWNKQIPRRIIQQVTKKYHQTGSWTVSTSNIDMDNFWKPGGTGMLSMGVSNGRVKDRGVDPWKMGRWSYNLLSGSEAGKTLLIITGYRVGQRTGLPGPQTAWFQQQTMLLKDNRNDNPYEAFLTDLSKWLRQFQKDNMELLICLDANEQWGENSTIAKFADQFNLSNINQEFQLSATHPNIANPSRGTTIDFCLGTPAVVENIQYASSTPFELETLGDHRGIILDINISRLLGEIPMEEEIKHRKLVLSSPKAVEKYIEIVDEKFQQQNIFSRSNKLLKRVIQGHTDVAHIMRQYEAIDKEVLGICQKAERKCRPAWAGKHEWSPSLARAIKELQYWRYRLKEKDETVVTKNLGKELNIKYTPLSQFVIHMMINKGRATLTEIQNNAKQHRKDHLDLVAQNYAAQNNLSKNQAILELVSHEESRNTFRSLRQRLKPSSRSRLKTLWTAIDEHGNHTKDHSQKEIFTDRDSIHYNLLRRNLDHLRQASQTPFAKGWFRNRLKWDGTGKLADEMLTGDILNKYRFDEAMQLYLESIQMDDMSRMNIVQPTLTLEEYGLFWKKKRETTVTSPHGLHVGHYKAALYKLSILNVHRILLLIPFKIGLVPTRWRRTVQTMLEKEPGSPWIHRLRIIELFDAQANAGFQIFVGRKLMQHAVTNDLLQAESFGSTPGKMATSALVQKIVAIDQLRIERRAGGIFDCDASGCYDRILPPLASVHLRALGLHHSIGTFLARLMFQAKRYVRTGHGVSKEAIRTTKKRVLHGIGQGNGGGPAIWISHLTVMFAAISSVCMGFALTCIQSILAVATVGTGYVNDVTLGLSVPRDQPQNEYHVFKHIKRMGQLWEKLLFITGGRLELSKCFWIPITWKWQGGTPTLIIKQARAHSLRLWESESDESIHIPRKSAKEYEKRLGVWSSCTGQWNKEVNLWISYSKDFRQKLYGGGLTRQAGYMAYHSIWVARFRYSAAVIGYTENQLSAIQSTIVGPCLSVAGYNQKFPRAIVFGPKKYGGLGWEDISVLNIYEKLKLFIGSIRLQDKLGAMLLIQLTWLQLFAGIGTPLLEYTKIIPYLPVGWLTNIHHQLVTLGIQICLSSGWTPTKQREHDFVLMDRVHAHVPRWAWEGINRCRLFLQATTLADLVTADGKFIPRQVFEVKKKLRESQLLYPVQKRPYAEDIEQWQYLLNSISINGHLLTPLGQWTWSPDQIFSHLAEPVQNTVYKKTSTGWTVFRKQSQRSRRYIKLRLSVTTIPEDTIPVQVIESSTYLLTLPSHMSLPKSLTPTQSRYKLREEISETQVIGKFEINSSLLEELEAKWQRVDCTLVSATDGGLKDNIGTSSYAIFFPQQDTPILSGRAGEYQPDDSASSTRQELLGQLGIEYWLSRLERKWGRPRNGINLLLITDSQASLDIMENVGNQIGIKDTLRPEMDVAMELHHQCTKHPWVRRNISKVESHINILDSPDEFEWECNTYVDALATKARLEFPLTNLKAQRHYLLPGVRAGCKINGRLVNNTLYQSLKQHVNGTTLRTYLMEKYAWTETIFFSIDWKAHHRALLQFPRQRRVTLEKYIFGWLATKKRRNRERQSPTDKCTLCGMTEGNMHFVECQDIQMGTIRKIAWEKLTMEVTSNTAIDFKAIFLSGMHSILVGDVPATDVQQDWPAPLQLAFNAQTEIGWNQLLLGRIAQQWDALAQYNVGFDRELRPGIWTKRAVNLFWNFGLELWTIRNKTVHGTLGGISVLEQERISRLVSLIYSDLIPLIERRGQVVIDRTEESIHDSSYQSQVAWLSRLQYLYPSEYKDIAARIGENGD